VEGVLGVNGAGDAKMYLPLLFLEMPEILLKTLRLIPELRLDSIGAGVFCQLKGLKSQ